MRNIRKNLWIRTFCLLLIAVMLISCVPVAPKVSAAPSPTSKAATLAWTLKGLNHALVVQNFYIGEQYMYISQSSGNTTYISRLTLNATNKTATYKDEMTLTNWGCGETLDFYRHKNNEYLLVGSKGLTDNDSYYSSQVARIKYVAGKTYSDYTGVTRLSSLDCVTSDGRDDGTIYRVAAAVQGQWTMIRVVFNKNEFVRYTLFHTDVLNNAMDANENTNTSIATLIKNNGAYQKSFKQVCSEDSYVHPNNSFQGIEMSMREAIYVSGGNGGTEKPQIAMMDREGNYVKQVTITNWGSGTQPSIQGMQADQGNLYFAVATGSDRKNEQQIYYIPESTFGINHVLLQSVGTRSCTAAGTNPYVYCRECGVAQDVQETFPARGHAYRTIPAVAATCSTYGKTQGSYCDNCGHWATAQTDITPTGHSYNAGVMTQSATCTRKGIITYTCSKCSDSYTEEQEKLLHKDLNDDSLCDVCGGSVDAEPLGILMDYAKTIETNITEKVIINGIPQEHLRDATLLSVSAADNGDSSLFNASIFDSDGDGKADSLRFKAEAILQKILLLHCKIRFTGPDGTVYERTIPVNVVPSTATYYETDGLTDVFQLTTTGTAWKQVGTSQSEDQDNGDCDDPLGDQVYDMQNIPSNAFFADFNGETTRYQRDSVYGGKNYDQEATWGYNTSRVKSLKIDPVLGTMTLTQANTSETGIYFQTSNDITKNFELNYFPEDNHYAVVRFKLANMQLYDSNGTAGFQVRYYTATDRTETKNDQTDHLQFAGEGRLTTEEFATVQKGEYVTITFPVTFPNSYERRKVTSLRFTIDNVRSLSDTQLGSITLDYIYVGPLEEKGATETIDHQYYENPTYGANDYLLFDFDNSPNARARYNHTAYKNNVNYDTATHWTALYDNNSADGKNENVKREGKAVTVNNVKGTLTLDVARQQSAVGRWGSYLGITDGSHQLISFMDVGTDRSLYPCLNFVPKSNTTYYFHIRLKITGCKKDDLMKPEDGVSVQFSCINSGSTNWLFNNTPTFPLVLDQYITLSENVTEQVAACNNIVALYFRFNNLTKSGSSNGKIEIDYIYLGPEKDPTKIRSPKEENILMDFDNGDYDRNRYAGQLYGGVNYDAPATWTNDYWYTHTIANSIMTLTPTTNAKGTTHDNVNGWGQKNQNSDYSSLSYKMTGEDYIIARVRTNHITPAPAGSANANFSFYFGQYHKGSLDEFHSGWKPMDVVSNNQKWVDYVFDISSFADKIDTITFFRPVFNNMNYGTNGTIDIEYIYIGSRKNGTMPAESLYFGFGNRLEDQARYDSMTYGNLNFDLSENLYNRENAPSIQVNNDMGLLEVKPAAGSTYFAVDTTNASASFPLNFHPEEVEICQIRFKMENFETHSSGDPFFRFQYFYDNQHDAVSVGDTTFNTRYLTNGEYITLTVDLRENDIRNVAEILRVRVLFGHLVANANSKVTIDYVYVGPGMVPDNPDMTYGYDSTYQNDANFSNGSSMFVEGAGVPMMKNKTDSNGNEILDEKGQPMVMIDYDSAKNYTEASFTFTGTGFDLISRTGQNQAALRVAVCDTDGYVKKSITVQLKGVTELYQIPVVSVTDLEYGTYTVHIFVNAAYTNTILPQLSRGGEFHFDAVRIYNTVNTDNAQGNSSYAYDIYQDHGEADPTFKELRDILIDASNGDPKATMDGVVYLDISGNTTTNTVGKYQSDGPKNEVYLTPGNAIAFKLEVAGRIPASIDIGAKSANGSAVTMTVGVGSTVSAAKSGGTARSITTAAAQYYPMKIDSSLWVTSGGKSYVYVMISNTGTAGILSVTNIKYAYDVPKTQTATATNYLHFTIDPTMMRQLLVNCEHEWGEGILTVSPTCKETGRMAYTCGLCEETMTEELPALGHGYLYTPADTEHHNVTCSRCDYFATVPHVYVGRDCICGQVESIAPVVEPNWKMGHTLDLASDISVNLAVNKTLLAGFDPDTVYVLAEMDTYEGNTKTGIKTVELRPVEQGNYYYFTLNGLTAVNMNDGIRSVLYGTKDGQLYYSPTDFYSIATYAYSQMNNPARPETLKTLCADLLSYGAKTQIYKEYRTDALADSAMTEEHKAFLTDGETVVFGDTNVESDDLPTASVKWEGKALDLASKVTLKFIFSMGTYGGELSDLTLRVSYEDVNGNAKSLILTNGEVYNADYGYYAFTLDALLAAELRSVLTVQIYEGENPVSCTLQYSPDTYGNNKTGALLDVCKALFAYSDSAKAFFAD